METLTNLICDGTLAADRIEIFTAGYDDGFARQQMWPHACDVWMAVRKRYGFTAWADWPTPPSANMKLDDTVAYGLTIQSAHTKLSNGVWVNACPNVGHCGKVCVLLNGNGAYPTVQRARDAKTECVALHPLESLYLIGHGIGKAVRKHGHILWRPDVNSDNDWDRILPGVLANLGGVTAYGYSKRPAVLARRPLGVDYTIAYSLNETSDLDVLQQFLDRGGNIAVVTDRKKGQPVDQWASSLGLYASVVDADKTDAWMLQFAGVIGDLSAKGKARSLIGKSDFIRTVYNPTRVMVGV